MISRSLGARLEHLLPPQLEDEVRRLLQLLDSRFTIGASSESTSDDQDLSGESFSFLGRCSELALGGVLPRLKLGLEKRGLGQLKRTALLE